MATCLIVATLYTAWAAVRTQRGTDGGAVASPAAGTGDVAASPGASNAEPGSGSPRLAYQHVARDANYAQVATVPIDAPDGQPAWTGLTCERVHMSGGRGLCLVPEPGLVSRYWAILFDGTFKEAHRIELAGSPSRARVSRDGRLGATTVFVFGHSYADDAFSTHTTIIDMSAGTVVAELEQFSAFQDGRQIHSPDFNYWGVTFAEDSNTFYATLRTAGETYLVRGDVQAREIQVLRPNAECPSLSPDGSRIAFKKLVGAAGSWRFTVLDLATMQEIPLSETESVDDQLEWLDGDRLLYGKAGHVWTVRSDGSGSPELFRRDALSPAILR